MPKRAPKPQTLDPVAWADPATDETDLLAVDPGDVYTGVAFFTETDDNEWLCTDAQELSPDDFEEGLADLILTPRQHSLRYLVFERFRLYGDKAQLQKGSEFRTSQCIGVMQFLVRVHNEHVRKHDEAEAAGKMLTCELPNASCQTFRPQRIEIVGQMADIKKPTAGILRTKKIKSVAGPIARTEYGGRDHVKDAELHGWRYILKDLGGSPSS